MAETTITEALAEIKTIEARLGKKRESIIPYIARGAQLRDPMEDIEGGSSEFIRRERQAITDLEERVIRIRTAIQAKNQEVLLTLGERTRTLAGWLTWRREIAEGQKQYLAQLFQTIQHTRAQARGRQVVQAGDASAGKPEETVIINIKESELTAQIESIETTLGDLDGKLSLLNATTKITIDD